MSDELTSTVYATGTTTNPGTVTTGTQPDVAALLAKAQRDAEEWRNRFTGLQGKYQQEQSKWAGDAAKLIDATEQLTKLVGEKEATTLELTSTKEKLDLLATEKVTLEANLERLNIITSEFPTLIPFLKDGLIPDETGDELRGKLKLLNDRISEIKGSAKTEQVKGAQPQSQPTPADSSPQALLAQAKDAMRSGNMAEYNKFYDLYIQAKQPKE